METFTLVIWLMMGQRYEATQVEHLTRRECVVRRREIEWALAAKGQCFHRKSLVPQSIE